MGAEKTYTTKEFAQIVGRKTRTLYIWDRSGKLIPKKDFNGRNIYTQEDYLKVMGSQLDDNDV
jgi:DNA-binding transcriptional MerR regulator